jgi:hypothetical protein
LKRRGRGEDDYGAHYCEPPLFAALSFLQDLDHGGGTSNSCGFVLFQGEEFLVTGHEELGLAGFSQRKQITVLGVRRDGAGGQVPAKKREVPKARGEQLGRAGAKVSVIERAIETAALTNAGERPVSMLLYWKCSVPSSYPEQTWITEIPRCCCSR